MKSLLTSAALLLATSASAQKLNKWNQAIFSTGGGTPGFYSTLAVDGDVDTYGLYIQLSRDSILADFEVEAYVPSQGFYGVVGRVCGTTSNITVVTFSSPDVKDTITSNTMFVTSKERVTVARRSSMRSGLSRLSYIPLGESVPR
ncbi:hypothetical protein B0H67DRAFT_669625 [Lasiosphaeris hirsuta]|uniref:Reelin domain-containing protein n=1 Tax=Lasiosphaeris hirsuta TaxID=260670 RepID=A0AA40A9V6_9PEZI|nr:hypothetical protein B0H67DRAFT_669625 [Lasiosphaeris hirsuta]